MRSQEQLRQPYRQNKDSGDNVTPPADESYTKDWTSSWPAGSNSTLRTVPEFTVAPTGLPETDVAGETFTFTLGTATGKPTPTLVGVLLRDAVDVTEDMVGLTYVSPAGAATLTWTVTATNLMGSDVSTPVEVTVTTE